MAKDVITVGIVLLLLLLAFSQSMFFLMASKSIEQQELLPDAIPEQSQNFSIITSTSQVPFSVTTQAFGTFSQSIRTMFAAIVGGGKQIFVY